jgi:hypothetical protein
MKNSCNLKVKHQYLGKPLPPGGGVGVGQLKADKWIFHLRKALSIILIPE